MAQQQAVRAAASPAAAGPAESLPRVKVRGGRHDGFSRLVFDWESPVGELLEEAPGRARLLFDRPAEFDLSAVNLARLPQKIGRAHVCTPVTNAHLVCRITLENKK